MTHREEVISLNQSSRTEAALHTVYLNIYTVTAYILHYRAVILITLHLFLVYQLLYDISHHFFQMNT